jgi:hypothetical protein
MTPNGVVAFITPPGHADEVFKANAHLIAAAPELLAALEFLMSSKWKSDDKDNMEFVGRVTCDQLDKARAAIAAAKGGA